MAIKCGALKADDKCKMIPVIFISALGMTEQKIEAFREGAVDYMSISVYSIPRFRSKVYHQFGVKYTTLSL